jgi:hypothetical protein
MSIKEFVCKYPYPSYEEMTDTWLQTRIDLDAEYGLKNHELCREIYQNLATSKQQDKVTKFVSIVFATGGKQALKCNIEVLMKYSPFIYCNDPTLRSAMETVKKQIDECILVSDEETSNKKRKTDLL